MKHCRALFKKDKPKYIKEYLEERKIHGNCRKTHSVLDRLTKSKKAQNKAEFSILSLKSFANRLTDQVCIKNGADSNVMDMRIMRAIEAEGADFTVEKLGSPRVFKVAAAMTDGMPTCLTCKSTVCLFTEVKIRHGAAMVL